MDIPSLLILLLPVGLFAFFVARAFGPKAKVREEKWKAEKTELKSRLAAQGVEFVPSSLKRIHFFWFVVAFTTIIAAFSFALFQGEIWYTMVSLFMGVTLGLVFAALSAMVADKAEEVGRSWLSFFWLSLLISPLITWLVVSSLQPLLQPRDPSLRQESIGDRLEQLEKLGSLLREGLINQEEFERQKARILD